MLAGKQNVIPEASIERQSTGLRMVCNETLLIGTIAAMFTYSSCSDDAQRLSPGSQISGLTVAVRTANHGNIEHHMKLAMGGEVLKSNIPLH